VEDPTSPIVAGKVRVPVVLVVPVGIEPCQPAVPPSTVGDVTAEDAAKPEPVIKTAVPSGPELGVMVSDVVATAGSIIANGIADSRSRVIMIDVFNIVFIYFFLL